MEPSYSITPTTSMEGVADYRIRGFFSMPLYFTNFTDLYPFRENITTSNTFFAHVTDSITCTQFAKLLFVKLIFLDIHEI